MKDNTILIDGQNYDVDALTCEDLRPNYRTGRSVFISGSGKSCVKKYRTGVQTNIGDIEISVWMDLMRKLIVRLGETELQEQLQIWEKEKYVWVRTSAEIEQNTLELHALRSFDSPQWDDYIAFNRLYRSEILEAAFRLGNAERQSR